MKSIDQENAELKAQLAEQGTRLAALEAKINPPKQAPPKIEGVQVFHPAPVASCVMPTRAQLEQLVELAFGAYPQWRPRDWSDEFVPSKYLDGFERAFQWVNSVARVPEPNTKRYLSHWNDCCEDWCRARGMPTSIWGLMIAAIVSGVTYQLADGSTGTVAGLGIAEYGDGRPGEDRWRHVLEAGVLPKPFIPRTAGSQNYPTPKVEVRQLDMTRAQGEQY